MPFTGLGPTTVRLAFLPGHMKSRCASYHSLLPIGRVYFGISAQDALETTSQMEVIGYRELFSLDTTNLAPLLHFAT
jgi:hypothetical protein